MEHVSEEDFARVMTKLETFLDATITLDPPGPGSVTSGEAFTDQHSPTVNPPGLDEVLGELVELGSVSHSQMQRIIAAIRPIMAENAKLKDETTNYETDY